MANFWITDWSSKGLKLLIVEKIMKSEVYTLSPNNTVEEALRLMEEKRIRHLPILNEQNNVVGIVSDRDLRSIVPSAIRENVSKEEREKPLSVLMNKEVVTGHPLDFVEDIAGIFYEYKIGCLPIVQQEKLVGIVTKTDVLRTFVQLAGANQPSSQIEIKVKNIAGKLSDVTAVFRNRNVNILSVLVYPDDNELYKILVFRIGTMNPTTIIQDLKKEGYDVLWPNILGKEL